MPSKAYTLTPSPYMQDNAHLEGLHKPEGTVWADLMWFAGTLLIATCLMLDETGLMSAHAEDPGDIKAFMSVQPDLAMPAHSLQGTTDMKQ